MRFSALKFNHEPFTVREEDTRIEPLRPTFLYEMREPALRLDHLYCLLSILGAVLVVIGSMAIALLKTD